MMQVLNGSLVALVTPMMPNGDIDFNALDKIIDWHIKEGTNGIVSVGTTGESATVNFDEHIKIIKHTINYVDGRVPVIAGTGANSTSEALDLTMEAKNMGANYALIVTPYYNKPSQVGLIEHYTKIADSIDIPQILYNVPSRTACDLLPSSVEVLSDHKNIIGIKEAVDIEERMKDLIKISNTNENFKIYSGDDPSFLKMLMLGGHGVISVAANIVPKYISEICSLCLDNKINNAQMVNEKLTKIYDLLFIQSNPIPVKWMMYKMGLIQNFLRLPLTELDEKYKELIISEMLKLELL